MLFGYVSSSNIWCYDICFHFYPIDFNIFCSKINLNFVHAVRRTVYNFDIPNFYITYLTTLLKCYHGHMWLLISCNIIITIFAALHEQSITLQEQFTLSFIPAYCTCNHQQCHLCCCPGQLRYRMTRRQRYSRCRQYLPTRKSMCNCTRIQRSTSRAPVNLIFST